MSSLHSHLEWTEDLDTLRRVARKTWPADVGQREGWTQGELEWVNNWFEGQQPLLMAPNEQGLVDPFELEIWNDEHHIGGARLTRSLWTTPRSRSRP